MRTRRLVIFGWADSAHVQRWARGLTERGWLVRVVSLGGQTVEGIDTQVIPRRGKVSFVTQSRRAANLALEFNPDIVHVHYAGGFGLWGIRTGRHPLVVSVWGADVIDLPRNFWMRRLVERTLREADHVTATSDMLRNVTGKQFPVTKEKTTVIPFGVTIPDTIAPPPDGPVRLCYIKKHTAKYGPDVLLHALRLVRQRIPDVTLTMAGSGEMTAELKALAESLTLTNAVDFVGLIPNEKIYSLLVRHHIMVMPSVMASETFGVAVLEAAACGRPTIASRVGGVPEVLLDGKSGLLVAPNDTEALAEAIVSLAGDADRCRAMGEAGREFAREKYSWDKSLDRMIEIYEQVLHD